MLYTCKPHKFLTQLNYHLYFLIKKKLKFTAPQLEEPKLSKQEIIPRSFRNAGCQHDSLRRFSKLLINGFAEINSYFSRYHVYLCYMKLAYWTVVAAQTQFSVSSVFGSHMVLSWYSNNYIYYYYCHYCYYYFIIIYVQNYSHDIRIIVIVIITTFLIFIIIHIYLYHYNRRSSSEILHLSYGALQKQGLRYEMLSCIILS